MNDRQSTDSKLRELLQANKGFNDNDFLIMKQLMSQANLQATDIPEVSIKQSKKKSHVVSIKAPEKESLYPTISFTKPQGTSFPEKNFHLNNKQHRIDSKSGADLTVGKWLQESKDYYRFSVGIFYPLPSIPPIPTKSKPNTNGNEIPLVNLSKTGHKKTAHR